MDVSLIIVNWNSMAYLGRCLASIYRNTAGITVEVIVTDNASFDGSREMVANDYPQVIFLQNTVNAGFAAANNAAADRARGSRLLFLNPDTEVIGDAIVQMASVFDRREDAGVVGCKLLNSDGSLQTSCIQPFPTILNQVLMAEAVLRGASRMGMWNVGPLSSQRKDIYRTAAISGACLMVRKDAFHQVGGFSPDYFMYTEDIDLCHKIERTGRTNYYINYASVTHHGGGSSHQRKENSFANIQMRESIFKFLQKTRGEIYARCYRSAMGVVAVARIGILSVLFVVNLFTGGVSRTRGAIAKWTGILRWSLALEKWTR